MNERDREEINRIVRKYSRLHEIAVVQEAMERGRVNKTGMVRGGYSKRHVEETLARLRKELKDFR